MKNEYSWSFRIFGRRIGVSIFRRYRAARFHGEIFRGESCTFASAGIASPKYHAPWAFTVYVYVYRN